MASSLSNLANNHLKEFIKSNVTLKKENMKEYNPNCSQISGHSYRILIIGGSESRKTNSLVYLTTR